MRLTYIALFAFSLFASVTLQAQESPYFVTYDHHLEEPGNLEIETSSTVGVPRAGQHWFFAPYLELEYGVTGRWTSELYLEGHRMSCALQCAVRSRLFTVSTADHEVCRFLGVPERQFLQHSQI